jgi:hypothetical protein
MRNQFCPLAYTQTSVIEWLNFKQLKGKNIQPYTQEFKKNVLTLEIPLHTLEMLL